jgi:Tol biopolymer transport system component
VAYAAKSAGNWDIFVRLLGSDESINLTRNSPDDDTQPAFSPNGSRIAFRSDRQGGGIFVMNADGSSVTRLSEEGYNPAWSPDGKQILYAEEGILRPEDRTGRLSRLWVVEVANGRKRLLRRDDAVQPQWSPNGQFIAYWGIDLDSHRDIWIAPASGGQGARITRDLADSHQREFRRAAGSAGANPHAGALHRPPELFPRWPAPGLRAPGDHGADPHGAL